MEMAKGMNMSESSQIVRESTKPDKPNAFIFQLGGFYFEIALMT